MAPHLIDPPLPHPALEAVAPEYTDLWDSMVISPHHLSDVARAVARITRNQPRYAAVSVSAIVPWQIVAVIHCLEGDLDFGTHLHNGDPLSGCTVNEPSGRPDTHPPPFTWEESAVDAMALDLDPLPAPLVASIRSGNLAAWLMFLEGYNGWGSRCRHGIHTPYLWSFTNHYASGKYVSDGKWDDSAVSNQPGAAPLLRALLDT